MLNSSNRLACRLQRWSSSGQSPTARSHNFTLNTHQHYITTETRAKKSLVHSAGGACTHNPATPSKQKVHLLAARFEVRKLLCKLPSKPWRYGLTSLHWPYHSHRRCCSSCPDRASARTFHSSVEYLWEGRTKILRINALPSNKQKSQANFQTAF